jgi:nitrate/nitrite transporter NarK
MALWLMHVFHDQWRVFWMIQAVTAVVVGIVCIALVGAPAWLARRALQTDADVAKEVSKPRSKHVYRTAVQWTAAQAIRTPQFYILLAAYFGHMLVGITISSFSVAHITQRGTSEKVAVLMLSIESLAGAAGRALGGAIGDLIDPRYLLLLSLAALTVGGLALSVAHGYPMLVVYAIGSGVGFGLTALAVTLLLLNYYGRTNNLEIFSRTCLIGAISALGPWGAGVIRDNTGGFSTAFQLFAAVSAVIFVAVVFMRPPRHHTAPQEGEGARSVAAHLIEDPA